MEDHDSVVARSLEQYSVLLPRLNAASDAIGDAIRARLRDDGLNHHTVQARVKDPGSVKEKLDRLTADGRFKYERGLEQLDDLIGVRIIMFLEPDIADVATALKGQFDCREDDDKTSSQRRNGQIGYAGRHLILEVPAGNVPVGCHTFIGERFEVQIRTVLQHAWAAFEHDIRYKGLAEANAEVDRAFTMASTLIELADAQFSAINDIVKRRQAESTAEFAANPATELTGDILHDMLARLLPEHPRSQPGSTAGWGTCWRPTGCGPWPTPRSCSVPPTGPAWRSGWTINSPPATSGLPTTSCSRRGERTTLRGPSPWAATPNGRRS